MWDEASLPGISSHGDMLTAGEAGTKVLQMNPANTVRTGLGKPTAARTWKTAFHPLNCIGKDSLLQISCGGTPGRDPDKRLSAPLDSQLRT